jgi:flavin reductase (DIM6/NTAB) family NADH-FMN oxidoreductase RutF
MKKAISSEDARRLINAGNLILVSAADGDKKSIATIAWHMPVSSEPPLIAVALSKEHYTSELIMMSEEFTINIPSWPILDKVILCGNVSGRDKDKFAEAGLTDDSPAKLVESPRVKECIASIECELYETKELGDHYIFIGQPVYAEVEEDLFADNAWDSAASELIFHLGGKYFCKAGERVAK